MTTRLLIDTSSLVFRAFFALPSSITDAEGHPVNAVRGYLDMLPTIISGYGSDLRFINLLGSKRCNGFQVAPSL
jgi:5'-3' exonuclease